jgi:alkanesulfonate monooxygenase
VQVISGKPLCDNVEEVVAVGSNQVDELHDDSLAPTVGGALRFHWILSSLGGSARRGRAREDIDGALDLGQYLSFCRLAERCGIESLLMPFGFHRPDPVALSAALGVLTEKIKFLVAVRSAAMTPTYFAQQVNTLSMLTNGRVIVNIVAGLRPDEHRYYGDYLVHDDRYERTEEFFAICNRLWRDDEPVTFSGKYYRVEGARLKTPFVSPDRATPEIFVGGNSAWAQRLTISQGSCQIRIPDTPEKMRPQICRVLAHGGEVGIIVSLVCRPTHDEAVAAAYAAVEGLGEATGTHEHFYAKTDSVSFRSSYDLAQRPSDWLTPYLWTGAVPYMGAPAIALVGSPDEIVDAMFEYRSVGVTHFLSLGWPDEPEVTFFAQEVLPRVRERERHHD